MGLFACLKDQVAAILCILKIVFTICDARKMRSDEFFCTLLVYLVYIAKLSRYYTFARSTGVLRNAQRHTSTWEFCKLPAM